MSRSGYSIDYADDVLAIGRWNAQVASSLRGKRGRQLLQDMAAGMDAMPVRVLHANVLVGAQGECCALGAACKLRNIDVSNVDEQYPDQVASVLNISHQLAREVAYRNDEVGVEGETPETRWVRMRAWIEKQLDSKGEWE